MVRRIMARASADTPSLCGRFHRASELIGRRWTGAIIFVLLKARCRFATLRDAIPEITDRMLSERLQELDTLLAASVSVRRAAPAARCACGAPLVWGSHFCANCGRPAAATPPVVGCPHCGSALAADAKFCAVCGKAITPAQQSEAAAVEPQGELLEALPTPTHERWEQ